MAMLGSRRGWDERGARGSVRNTKLVVTHRANVFKRSRAFPTALAALVWLRNVYVATPIPIPGLTSDRDVGHMTRFPKDNSLLRCLCLVFSLMATGGFCVACVRRRPHFAHSASALACANTPTKQGMCAKSNTRQRRRRGAMLHEVSKTLHLNLYFCGWINAVRPHHHPPTPLTPVDPHPYRWWRKNPMT